jgi:hypothetical protein
MAASFGCFFAHPAYSLRIARLASSRRLDEQIMDFAPLVERGLASVSQAPLGDRHSYAWARTDFAERFLCF